MTASRQTPVTSIDELPIDVEGGTEALDLALGMELNTSTREDIDLWTRILVGLMSELLATDLGADQDPKVMDSYHSCYRLLDLKTRPTRETPAFAAFSFMREVAVHTRPLLAAYQSKSEATVV